MLFHHPVLDLSVSEFLRGLTLHDLTHEHLLHLLATRVVLGTIMAIAHDSKKDLKSLP